MLGPPALVHPSGSVVRLEGKALALVTYLALEGSASRLRVASLLWPDTLEGAARNNLVHLIRRIHKLTGEKLVLADDRVSLSPQVTVDATVFLESSPGRGDLSAVGPLLQDVDFDDCPDLADWLLTWRERLDHRQTVALTDRATQQEDTGNLTGALTTTLRLLDLNPVSEDAYRRLIRLHYLAGDRAAALRAFERCQEVLRREIGVDPLPETVQLAREVERGEVRSPAPLRRRLPVSVLRPPHLVGREDAWARMEEAWEAGQFIILAGEAGVGKSRLARDFAASKGEVLHLEGRPGDAVVPYATTARNLRRIFARTPDLVLEPWMRASLAWLLPELRTDTEMPAAPAPSLHAAIRHVFQVGLAGVSSFIYDDLHLADPASMEAGFVLISSSFPLGQPGGVPHLICTVRPAELSSATTDIFRRGNAAGHNQRIDLKPLPEAAVAELLSDLGVPEVLGRAGQLTRFTGGNPFFVLETVKHLLDQPDAGGPLPVAERATQLIAERLSHLPALALSAARAAAILQSDLRVELVADVLGAPLLDLASAWEELEAAGVMNGERFSHDLVQETVMAGIPPSVGRLLHRSAARVLGREAASPARLARHWQEGGDLRAAAPLFVRAAEEALGALRPVEAVGFFGQAADLHDALGEHDAAFEVRLRAVESPWRTEQVASLHALIEQLAAGARTNEQRAWVSALRAGRLLGQGQAAASEATALEGLALLGNLRQSRVRAALLRELVQAMARQGKVDAVRSILEEVQTLHEALADERERALGEIALGGAYLRLGLNEEAEPHLRLATELFGMLGDTYRSAWATHNLAVTLHAREHFQEVIRLREDLDVQLGRANAPSLYRANLTELGIAHTRLRQYDQALSWLRRAEAHGDEVGEPRGSLDRAFTDLFWALGAHEECLAAAERALAHPDPRDAGAFLPWLAVGRVRAAQGDMGGALAAYRHVESGLGTHDFPYSRGLLLLAQGAHGAPQAATELASRALELARTHRFPDLETAALAARAEALLAHGDTEAARRDSEAAILRLPTHAPRDDFARPLLVHHRVLVAAGDAAARVPLQQALAWLAETVQRVPDEYRHAFLNTHVTHRALQVLGGRAPQ
ncbi:BTAD domain-containing putative transcriptional regulator [Deinococcus humi]|uniref:BTAD domain-containing putative transcriptional regulator n=1 Tax=Deinococcus humi TaxID=662880 RepID=UPI00160F638D